MNPAPPRKSSSKAKPLGGRRERHRLETRERIFRAALRLFAERGFVATTVGDITEAADVGKGTFFNYFPSKEHVLAAFPQMQVGKVRALAGDPATLELPLREVLLRMVRILAEEPGRSAALVRALVTAVLGSPAVRELVIVNVENAWQALGLLMARGQQRGEVRRDLDAVELGRDFHRMFFGSLLLWAVHPRGRLVNNLEQALEVFWSGIRAREEASREEKQP